MKLFLILTFLSYSLAAQATYQCEVFFEPIVKKGGATYDSWDDSKAVAASDAKHACVKKNPDRLCEVIFNELTGHYYEAVVQVFEVRRMTTKEILDEKCFRLLRCNLDIESRLLNELAGATEEDLTRINAALIRNGCVEGYQFDG